MRQPKFVRDMATESGFMCWELQSMQENIYAKNNRAFEHTTETYTYVYTWSQLGKKIDKSVHIPLLLLSPGRPWYPRVVADHRLDMQTVQTTHHSGGEMGIFISLAFELAYVLI